MDLEDGDEREITKAQRAAYVRKMKRARKHLMVFFHAAYVAGITMQTPMAMTVANGVIDCPDCKKTFEYKLEEKNPWFLYSGDCVVKSYCATCAQRRKDKQELLEAL